MTVTAGERDRDRRRGGVRRRAARATARSRCSTRRRRSSGCSRPSPTTCRAARSNAEAYAEPDQRAAPLVPWPDPVGGFALRVYRLADTPIAEGRFGRIFRTTNLMVNFLAEEPAPRDAAQAVAALPRRLRADLARGARAASCTTSATPGDPTRPSGAPDENREIATPSICVIPPPTVHTTQGVGAAPAADRHLLAAAGRLLGLRLGAQRRRLPGARDRTAPALPSRFRAGPRGPGPAGPRHLGEAPGDGEHGARRARRLRLRRSSTSSTPPIEPGDRRTGYIGIALLTGVSPIVRVPGLDGGLVQRLLDAGAEGIMVPARRHRRAGARPRRAPCGSRRSASRGVGSTSRAGAVGGAPARGVPAATARRRSCSSPRSRAPRGARQRRRDRGGRRRRRAARRRRRPLRRARAAAESDPDVVALIAARRRGTARRPGVPVGNAGGRERRVGAQASVDAGFTLHHDEQRRQPARRRRRGGRGRRDARDRRPPRPRSDRPPRTVPSTRGGPPCTDPIATPRTAPGRQGRPRRRGQRRHRRRRRPGASPRTAPPLMLVARTAGPLDAVADELAPTGHEVAYVTGDISVGGRRRPDRRRRRSSGSAGSTAPFNNAGADPGRPARRR